MKPFLFAVLLAGGSLLSCAYLTSFPVHLEMGKVDLRFSVLLEVYLFVIVFISISFSPSAEHICTYILAPIYFFNIKPKPTKK